MEAASLPDGATLISQYGAVFSMLKYFHDSH